MHYIAEKLEMWKFHWIIIMLHMQPWLPLHDANPWNIYFFNFWNIKIFWDSNFHLECSYGMRKNKCTSIFKVLFNHTKGASDHKIWSSQKLFFFEKNNVPWFVWFCAKELLHVVSMQFKEIMELESKHVKKNSIF